LARRGWARHGGAWQGLGKAPTHRKGLTVDTFNKKLYVFDPNKQTVDSVSCRETKATYVLSNRYKRSFGYKSRIYKKHVDTPHSIYSTTPRGAISVALWRIESEIKLDEAALKKKHALREVLNTMLLYSTNNAGTNRAPYGPEENKDE